jgi:3-oxoacyl-[acyl-carrier protein] reductase
VDVNLNAPWYLSRAVLPSMRERRCGVIVNVGSVAAYASDALARGPYAASKAGLESLTRTIAGESGAFGVRCVGVHPGIISTPWMEERIASAQLKDSPALARLGTAEEVANVIVFLASDLASYITGETITVGGGFKMPPDPSPGLGALASHTPSPRTSWSPNSRRRCSDASGTVARRDARDDLMRR